MKMNWKNPNTILLSCLLRVIPVILITIAIVIIIFTVVVTVTVIYIVINISTAVLFSLKLVFCIDFYQVLGGSMDLRAPSTLHLELLWKS